MSINNSNYIKIIFFLIFTFFSRGIWGQNSELTNTVSISIVNKRFEVALKQIQEKFNLNFSYNSEIIPKNKLVSIKADNNRLDKILTAFLASADLQMLVVNDQIIIVKSNPLATEIKSYNPPKLTESNRKTEISGNIITVIDTVVHTIHDTIVSKIYDTIRITVYDTKFIRQQSNIPGIRWNPRFSAYVSSSMVYQLSNSFRLMSPDQQNFFQKYGIAEKSKIGYSLAGNFSVKNKRTEMALGIEFLNIYTDVPVMNLPQNMYKTKQVIISTTIKPDGIYYEYRTDTTWHNINYNPGNTIGHNSYTYFTFPLVLSYKCIQTKNLVLGINFGIVYSRLIKAKGIDASTNGGDVLLKNMNGESLSDENFLYLTGIEIEYPVAKKISLVSSVQYRYGSKSLYKKSFPISVKPNFIFPTLSIKYWL